MPHVGIPWSVFKARSVGNTELLIFVAAQTASDCAQENGPSGFGFVANWEYSTFLPDKYQSPVACRIEDRFYDFYSHFVDHDTANLFADGIDILEDYHLARPSVEERLHPRNQCWRQGGRH
jgi:hypothetical protein